MANNKVESRLPDFESLLLGESLLGERGHDYKTKRDGEPTKEQNKWNKDNWSPPPESNV